MTTILPMPATAPPAPPADPYVAARRALAILAQRPHDPQSLAGLVAAYRTLGLAAAGRRAIDSFLRKNPGAEQLAPLLAPLLVDVPAGVITWASRRRRFDANLQALAVGHPALAEQIAAAWPAASGQLELHLTRDGNAQILALTPEDEAGHWWGTLADHRRAAEQCRITLPPNRLVPPILLDGIGLGQSLIDILSTTHHVLLSYSPAVYIIEPHLAALAVALHLHDLRRWMVEPRLRWFTGESATADFAATLRAEPRWALPGIFLTHHFTPRAAPPTDFSALNQTIETERRAVDQAHRAAVAAHYADKTVAYWADRFRHAAPSDRPLRILGLASRYTTVLQHTIAELGAAITASGHHFTLAIEPDDQSIDAGIPDIINRVRPDLLIVISRLRFESGILPENVPFLCWDQDALPIMSTTAARDSLTPLTFIAGITPYEMMVRREWPSTNSIYCHLAAATHRYPRTAAPADLLQQYACDFSFVSNAATLPRQMLEASIADCRNPAHGALCRQIGEPLLAAGALQPDDPALAAALTSQAAQSNTPLDLTTRAQLLNALRKLADRVLRHTIVRWVAAYAIAQKKSFHLFGAGWENIPDLAPFARGPIAPGPHLHALCQASKINLQIARWGLLHSRPLDGMAAGGFFLTNHSVNDYDSLGLGDLPFRLARRALELDLRTVAEVESSTDPLLQQLWSKVSPIVSADERLGEFAYLRQCANMPPAEFLFPDLRAFTFTTQDDFNRQAEHFLNHPAARAALVDRNHAIVERECSYDARWKLFLDTMTNGLNQFARNAQ